MLHYGCERHDDFTAARIVRSHAAKPEAVLLRAVENRKLLLGDKLVALGLREAHCIAIALEIEEELCTVIVFPRTRIHSAAAQPDNHREVLDAYRALILTGTTGGALKYRFLRHRRA